MNGDDPSLTDEKVQVDREPRRQGALPVTVLSAREADDVELEVLAIIVEIRRFLRIQQFTARAAIQTEETGEMLHIPTIAPIDIHPQERPLIEASEALLIEIDLLVMAVGVVEEGLNHGVASGSQVLPGILGAMPRPQSRSDAG